jgi:hypothetical protein
VVASRQADTGHVEDRRDADYDEIHVAAGDCLDCTA